MKNINKIALFSLLPAMTLFFSCDEDKDKATGDSNLVATKDVIGSVNIPFTGVQSSNEKDETVYTFTITLDKPQVVPVVVAVHQISGNATSGDDYDVPKTITIPAYATSATATVKILNDDLVEGVETFTLQVGDIATSNAGIPTKTMSFSIDNYLSDDLVLDLIVDQPYSIFGTPYTLCGEGYDVDYGLFRGPTYAGSTFTGILVETVNCQEKMILGASLPDGQYHLAALVWDDADLPNLYHDPFRIPTNVEYFRAGGIAKNTFKQEDTFAPISTQPARSALYYVVSIEKAGNVFTLRNSVPEVIASGRGGDLPTIESIRPYLRKKH